MSWLTHIHISTVSLIILLLTILLACVELLPADQFASQYPTGRVSFSLTLPADTSPQGASWGLKGQQLTIESVDLSRTVKAVKELVAARIQQQSEGPEAIPLGRFQLKDCARGVFLKDASTLAAHNIGMQCLV